MTDDRPEVAAVSGADYERLDRDFVHATRQFAASVTNLSARPCSEARPWQILVTHRVVSAAEEIVIAESIGEPHLKGFSRPMRAFDVKAPDTAQVTT